MADDKQELTGLSLSIPKQLIEDTVKAQIISALGNRTDFIARIVSDALNRKMGDRAKEYSDQDRSIFTVMVEETLRAEAGDIVKQWVEEHRADIKAEFQKILTANRGKRLNEFCNALLDGVLKVEPKISVDFVRNDIKKIY